MIQCHAGFSATTHVLSDCYSRTRRNEYWYMSKGAEGLQDLPAVDITGEFNIKHYKVWYSAVERCNSKLSTGERGHDIAVIT